MLADFLKMDSNITVNFHIRTIDQAKAIKSIKSKITDLDKMKIEEQKKAVRSGYDMDLKGALTTIMRKIYGEDAVMRFRPHHFPFTEPSCEMDMQCHKCHGTGEIDGQVCSTCHGEGWIELLGAGMVHPKVLENCGIDPEKYSGFAFGMGLERMAMGRMKINDLRLIFDNDIRFLNQF